MLTNKTAGTQQATLFITGGGVVTVELPPYCAAMIVLSTDAP